MGGSMPCNAWNHPPGCDCGWGGVNYGSGVTSREIEAARAYEQAKAAEQRLVTALRPFTTPNARCPVCGAQVWFYQSPDGGRVFFDDIGWPWPKHPCTDHTSDGGRRTSASTSCIEVTEAIEKPLPAWQTNGDRPILRVLKQDRIPSVDILKSLARAVVEVANPSELVSLTWPAVSEIDWKLPAFLREPAGQVAELHILRWTGVTFEGRVIEVTVDRRDVWRHLWPS